MKASDKRKVPGLEDYSSDSNDDDDIPLKKSCISNDIEIELEVQENEFLKEESINNNNKSRKFNNIWGNVVQENMLDEGFNKVGVNKMNIQRNVESYSIGDQERPTRKRKHIRKNNDQLKSEQKSTNVKERLKCRSYNKSKDRSHVTINPESDSKEEIVLQIAKLLNEPKTDLLKKCCDVIGTDKFMEFYYLTQDIEDNGGLLVVSGKRRRSPGGVFLTLIKDSNEIDSESKMLIFDKEAPKRISEPIKMKIDCDQEWLSVVPDNNFWANPIHVPDTVSKDDDDLEEGEIL